MAARSPAEALWLANSSKQARLCLKAGSCWELEKQTLEPRWGAGSSFPTPAWPIGSTRDRGECSPAPGPDLLLTHEATESGEVHPAERLSLFARSPGAEGQTWPQLHAWPAPEPPPQGRLRAHSQPLVSLAQGTSQDQSPDEAAPVPTPCQGSRAGLTLPLPVPQQGPKPETPMCPTPTPRGSSSTISPPSSARVCSKVGSTRPVLSAQLPCIKPYKNPARPPHLIFPLG